MIAHVIPNASLKMQLGQMYPLEGTSLKMRQGHMSVLEGKSHAHMHIFSGFKKSNKLAAFTSYNRRIKTYPLQHRHKQ